MICIFAMAPKMRFYNFLESNGLFSFLTQAYWEDTDITLGIIILLG